MQQRQILYCPMRLETLNIDTPVKVHHKKGAVGDWLMGEEMGEGLVGGGGVGGGGVGGGGARGRGGSAAVGHLKKISSLSIVKLKNIHKSTYFFGFRKFRNKIHPPPLNIAEHCNTDVALMINTKCEMYLAHLSHSSLRG